MGCLGTVAYVTFAGGPVGACALVEEYWDSDSRQYPDYDHDYIVATLQSHLSFRALLTDGVREVRFERMTKS